MPKKVNIQEYTDILKLGTPASLQSPKSGRFFTNVNAKEWILIYEFGRVHHVMNLLEWAINNCEKFKKNQATNHLNKLHMVLAL